MDTRTLQVLLGIAIPAIIMLIIILKTGFLDSIMGETGCLVRLIALLFVFGILFILSFILVGFVISVVVK